MIGVVVALLALAIAVPANAWGVRDPDKDTPPGVPAPGLLPLAWAPLPFPDPSRPNAVGQRFMPGLAVDENPNEAIPAAVRISLEGFSPVGDTILLDLGQARAASGTFVSLDGEPTAYVLTARHVMENFRDGLPARFFGPFGFPGIPARPVTEWRVTQWQVVGNTLMPSTYDAVAAFEHPGLADIGIIEVMEETPDSAVVARAEVMTGTEVVMVGYGLAGPLLRESVFNGVSVALGEGPHFLPFLDALIGTNLEPLNAFYFTASERSLDWGEAIAKFGFGRGRKASQTVGQYGQSPTRGRVVSGDADVLYSSSVIDITYSPPSPPTFVAIPDAILADPLGDGGPIENEGIGGIHDSGTGFLIDEGASHPTIGAVNSWPHPELRNAGEFPSLGYPRYRAWIHRVLRVDRLRDAIDGLGAAADEKAELLKNLDKAVAKLDAADNDTLLLDEQYKEQRKAVNDLAQVEDILEDIGADGLRESVAILALEIAKESYKQATLLDPTGEPYIDPPSNPAWFASRTSRAQVKIADGYEELASGHYARAISKASGALNDLSNAVK